MALLSSRSLPDPVSQTARFGFIHFGEKSATVSRNRTALRPLFSDKGPLRMEGGRGVGGGLLFL